MVTEGVLADFRVLHKKCESDKEIVKVMALACVICIDRGDLIPRVLNLSYHSTASKRRDKGTIWELLDLTDVRQKKFELGRSDALRS